MHFLQTLVQSLKNAIKDLNYNLSDKSSAVGQEQKHYARTGERDEETGESIREDALLVVDWRKALDPTTIVMPGAKPLMHSQACMTPADYHASITTRTKFANVEDGKLWDRKLPNGTYRGGGGIF